MHEHEHDQHEAASKGDGDDACDGEMNDVDDGDDEVDGGDDDECCGGAEGKPPLGIEPRTFSLQD